MKSAVSLSLFLALSLSVFSQDRQQALAEFNALKSKAASLERVVLAPDDTDRAIAEQRSVSVIRILPRETYDNSFSSIRGGGAFYSFFYRVPEYGYGTELGWEQGYLSVSFNDFAVMADLGDISIDQISRESRGVIDLANYKSAIDPRASTDNEKVRTGGLMIGETLGIGRVKPIIGHTYVVRSIRVEWYDVLVAFTVLRQDNDKSLVLLWKLIEQNDTPRRASSEKPTVTDEQIRSKAQGLLRDERLHGVTISVSNKVLTLRGKVDRQFAAYAIEIANRTGAVKTINLLEFR